MRLKTLLLLCSIGSIVAAPVFSQKKLLSVSYMDKTVVEILNDLKVQTGYDFFYQKNIIPQSLKLTLTMDNASLEQILKEVLTDNNLSYLIKDDYVIVGPASALETVSQQPVRVQVQPIIIKTRVVDKDKVPITGVNVRIKNKTMGTVTNREGIASFILPPESGIILVFSFTGMRKQEIAYSGQELIEVVMSEEITKIEEIVVTGYSEIAAEHFTGSSNLITKEDLRKLNASNVIDAIQVFDPSFKIVMNNKMGSDPNTMAEFYLRGRTGTPGVKQLDALNPADPTDISQFALQSNPSAPIFILDGHEVDATKINDLDENRIESITLLKDAAATAVYGSRAGNGVIVIQTIPPLPGEVRISYSGKLTATFPDLTSYDLLNAAEAVEAERLAGLFTGNPLSSSQMANGVIAYQQKMNLVRQGIETNWISKPLRSAYNHRHTVSVTGGSQELRYGLDLSYNRNDGVMKGSARNTYGAALTIDYRWRDLQVKNKVEVGGMNSTESPYGSFSDYVRMKPYLSPYDSQGNYLKRLTLPVATNLTSSVANPLYEASIGNFYETKYTEIMDYFSMIWRSPDTFWTIRGNFGISFKIDDAEKFTSPYSSIYFSVATSTAPEAMGTLSTSEVRATNWSGDLSLSYARTINKHNINFRVAGEAAESMSTSLSIAYRGFVNEIGSPSQAIEVVNKPTYRDNNTRRLSTFLQGNYSYADIYLFDISGRLDGSSVFGTDRKIAPFWSTGIGLNVHHYSFMSNMGWMDRLKLTATYGQTGKANFQPYQARTTYTPIYENHYANSMGMKLKAFGNSDLKWEKTRTWNFKAELGIKNLLVLQLEHYRIRTIDLVEDVTIPLSSGFSYYRSNIGEVMNKGYELALTVYVLHNDDWSINFINKLNHNTNKIVKIGEALENYNKRIDDFFAQYSTTNINYATPFMKYEEGSSLSAIYGMKSLGIDPARGDEIFVKRDGTVTNTWSSAEQQKLGDTEPKMAGSLQINVKWRRLELYTAFLYHWGGQAYNQTYQAIENIDLTLYNGDRRVLTECWRKVGDVTRLVNIANRTRVTRPTSRFVQDDNMFQFSSFTLTYNVKDEWLKRTLTINSARISLNMTDVATLSSIRQERGTTYPFARSFNLNLYIQF